MYNTNSVIFYRGPSMIDGAPIIAVATGLKNRSTNGKTGGELIQTFILRADMTAIEAVQTGADASICGDCKHRGEIVDGRNVGRSCYVNFAQAPHNISKTAARGRYREVSGADLEGLFAGRGVRLGSYGDPAAVPMHVWHSVMTGAAFWTGYTHQWLNESFIDLAQYCMASADTAAERFVAKAMGYRTFRVRGENEELDAREIVCPASAEAGHKTTCDKCKACGGNGAKAKADVAIIAHGTTGKVNAFAKRIAA